MEEITSEAKNLQSNSGKNVDKREYTSDSNLNKNMGSNNNPN